MRDYAVLLSSGSGGIAVEGNLLDAESVTTPNVPKIGGGGALAGIVLAGTSYAAAPN